MPDFTAFSDLFTAAEDGSVKARSRLLEQFCEFSDEQQVQAATILFKTKHHALREDVLAACRDIEVPDETWVNAIKQAVSDESAIKNAGFCQCVLVILQRLDHFDADLVTFYRSCLDHSNEDVRYQAYCVAELQEECSEEYLHRVEEYIDSKDVDLRIISIQALARLKPDWAMEKLSQRARSSSSTEKFHALLSMIRLCADDDRAKISKNIAHYLGDDRFSFAAAQALQEYGDPCVIPDLLRCANSFMAEPTIRIAAASAAAKLGSQDGIKILQKFLSNRHGNPNYAKEQLTKLGLL